MEQSVAIEQGAVKLAHQAVGSGVGEFRDAQGVDEVAAVSCGVGLQRFWPPLADTCRRLAADIGHPVFVNAYLT
ncbi:hypothetical protein, partial [Streptomyces toxytricini]|uniref:hypothetical protein n=1 Tax=Streptomyces toxytricini TaxID=67369 RepID=UPI003444FD4C